MTSTLTITRRDERGEDRDFLIDVSRDRDGDIWSVCGEDVAELRTTNRYGSIETYATGRLLYKKGEPIELEDDELTEAESALSQLESLWTAERSRLREIFRPAEHPQDGGTTGTPASEASPFASSGGALLPPHDLLNSLGAGIVLPPGSLISSAPNSTPNEEVIPHGRRC